LLIESAASDEESSIASEFATTIKYVDLFLQQKTDRFLQNYVFEPVEFFAKNLMYLSMIVPLLAAGTLIVVVGVILLIATVVPLLGSPVDHGSQYLYLGRYNRILTRLKYDNLADPDGYGDDKAWKSMGRSLKNLFTFRYVLQRNRVLTKPVLC